MPVPATPADRKERGKVCAVLARERHWLDPLFRPRAVAVLGASPAGGRGARTIRNLGGFGFQGRVYPVNPRHSEVAGLPCLHSVDELPEVVDLAVLSLPAQRVPAALEDCHRNRIAAAIVYAAGLGEGSEGAALRDEMRAFHRRTGMAILGPNCIGFVNYVDRVAAYSSRLDPGARPGGVGIVAQSGSVAILMHCASQGPGCSLLVSSGNEVVVTSSDILEYLVGQSDTRVLATFMEGCREPGRLARVANTAFGQGKPLVVLKAGRTQRGGAATLAHTGSLAGPYAVQRSFLERLGVTLVEDLEEFVQTLALLSAASRPAGDGLAMMGLSGGEIALLLDLAESRRLRFAQLSTATCEKLRAILPGYVNVTNPLDATGAVIDDASLMDRTLEIVAHDPAVDVVGILQDTVGGNETAVHLAELAGRVAGEEGKPCVFMTNLADGVNSAVAERLAAGGVAYLHGARASLAALEHYLDFYRRPKDRSAPLQSGPPTRLRALTEREGLAVLRAAGVPTVETRHVTTPAEAAEAASALGFPVVVKVSSADVPHKSKAGGVRLDVRSAAEAARAFSDVTDAVLRTAPRMGVDGAIVQPMAVSGVEALVGIKRDPQWGLFVYLGLGGVLAESPHPRALRPVPVAREEAGEMVGEVFPPGWSAPALVEALIAVSVLAERRASDIGELDINPLIVSPDGARVLAVDALVYASR